MMDPTEPREDGSNEVVSNRLSSRSALTHKVWRLSWQDSDGVRLAWYLNGRDALDAAHRRRSVDPCSDPFIEADEIPFSREMQ